MFDFDDGALLDQSGSTDPIFAQLRAVSHQIPVVRARIQGQLSAMSNADAMVDFTQLTSDTALLAQLHDQMLGLIAQFKASGAYQADAQTAALLDNWLAFAGEWAKETIVGVPDGLAAVSGYLASIVAKTTGAVAGALSPILLGVLALGAVALFAVKQAEKTRTYRHYVA